MFNPTFKPHNLQKQVNLYLLLRNFSESPYHNRYHHNLHRNNPVSYSRLIKKYHLLIFLHKHRPRRATARLPLPRLKFCHWSNLIHAIHSRSKSIQRTRWAQPIGNKTKNKKTIGTKIKLKIQCVHKRSYLNVIGNPKMIDYMHQSLSYLIY